MSDVRGSITHMRRTLTAIALATILALGLAGCSEGNSEAKTDEAPKSEAKQDAGNERTYLRYIKEHAGQTIQFAEQERDTMWLSMGEEACKQFKTTIKNTGELTEADVDKQVNAFAKQNGISKDDAVTIHVGAMSHLCPTTRDAYPTQ